MAHAPPLPRSIGGDCDPQSSSCILVRFCRRAGERNARWGMMITASKITKVLMRGSNRATRKKSSANRVNHRISWFPWRKQNALHTDEEKAVFLRKRINNGHYFFSFGIIGSVMSKRACWLLSARQEFCCSNQVFHSAGRSGHYSPFFGQFFNRISSGISIIMFYSHMITPKVIHTLNALIYFIHLLSHLFKTVFGGQQTEGAGFGFLAHEPPDALNTPLFCRPAGFWALPEARRATSSLFGQQGSVEAT